MKIQNWELFYKNIASVYVAMNNCEPEERKDKLLYHIEILNTVRVDVYQEENKVYVLCPFRIDCINGLDSVSEEIDLKLDFSDVFLISGIIHYQEIYSTTVKLQAIKTLLSNLHRMIGDSSNPLGIDLKYTNKLSVAQYYITNILNFVSN